MGKLQDAALLYYKLLNFYCGFIIEWVKRYLMVTRNLKKISKRNLPNVGIGEWMEVLADKVHKQGEHIPQHCYYISHNHAYCAT